MDLLIAWGAVGQNPWGVEVGDVVLLEWRGGAEPATYYVFAVRTDERGFLGVNVITEGRRTAELLRVPWGDIASLTIKERGT